MMKQRKRFLSAALSVLLSLTLCTPAVLAEDEGKEQPEEIQETAPEELALAAEESGEEKEGEQAEGEPEKAEESIPEAVNEEPASEALAENEAISAEETEPEALPEEESKRFAIPEGYAVSERDLRLKDMLRNSDIPETLPGMEEGRDFERNELVVMSDRREDAESVAAIYQGELKSWSYGIGVIQLKDDGPSVKECVLACLEDENLPFVEPNYITVIEAAEDPVRESEAEGELLPKEKTWNEWIYGAFENPDEYLLVPTDNYYCWHLAEIDAYKGWNATMGSDEIKVAVIDTYINPDHQDLTGKVTNYDIGRGTYVGISGHGTQMAGVIAATANNRSGGAGIAPNVKILGINIFYYKEDIKDDTYTSADLVIAINLAVKEGASIINMSLGAVYYQALEEEAVNNAYDQGVTVVASAGNDGSNIKKYPGAFDKTIAVGATGKNHNRTFFSNYGPWVTVSAPGNEIPAPLTSMDEPYSNTYTLSSGTSPAAAVVSGALALYMSKFGKITPKESFDLVKKNVERCGSSGMGSGIINVGKMFEKDSQVPVIKAFDKNDQPVTDFKQPMEQGDYIIIENPHPGDQDTIVFTTDGKAPVIKDGEVVHGFVYQPGEHLLVDDYEMNASMKFTAVIVNSFGAAGKSASLSIKTPVPPYAEVKIKTVKLKDSSATIGVSDAQGIHGSVKMEVTSLIDENGQPVNLQDVYHEWDTSDPAVARPDAQGNVTAYSAGSATIKIKILDGSNKTAYCKITVVQLAESAVIEGQNSIVPGSSASYKAAISPSNTKSKKVEWSLKEPVVEGVSIDKNGKVKVDAGVAAGTSFTITATCLDESGVTAEKTVAVAAKATAIALASDDPRVIRNAKNVITGAYVFTNDLKDALHPAQDNEILFSADITGNDIAPKWTSSNTKVATVDQNGKVTAHAAGTAKITAETMDGSKKKATVTVTVRVPISSLTIDSELEYILIPGMSRDYTKKIIYGNTYGKPTIQNADWTIVSVTQADEDITADVLAKKLVTMKNGKLSVSSYIENTYPLSKGSIFIKFRATAKDGTGFSFEETCSVLPAVTVFWLDGPDSKKVTVNPDKIYSVPLFVDSKTNFEVTTSNPNLAGVTIDNTRYQPYSYEKDGKTIEGYKFMIGLFVYDKTGTVTIKVRQLNGSGKTAKIKIKIVPEE